MPAKKIDYNQFPGKNFWRKIIDKKMFNDVDNVSNKSLVEQGKLIRIKVMQKIIDVPDENAYI